MPTAADSDPQFVKTFGSLEQAAEACRRTRFVSAAGLKTPACMPGPDCGQASYARIVGASGVALLDETPLSELLRPLALLHNVKPESLLPFDPFLRIDPRLGVEDSQADLREVISELRACAPNGLKTVHGDFHLGQLIQDGDGELWLIDFDDLAIGVPESDIGNLIANLSTRPETRLADLEASVVLWAERVLDALTVLGETFQPKLVVIFLKIALLRRGLKLRERDDRETLAAVKALLQRRDRPNFSIL